MVTTPLARDEPQVLTAASLGAAWLAIAAQILAEGIGSRYDDRPVRELSLVTLVVSGPDPDEAKIARYCASSLDHFDWLVARGVPFEPSFCADTSMAPDGTEGLVYSGGEDAYPFNQIATPAPRGPS